MFQIQLKMPDDGGRGTRAPTLRWVTFAVPAFAVARGEEAAGLARAVALLERYVAAHAEQWFNFYDVRAECKRPETARSEPEASEAWAPAKGER